MGQKPDSTTIVTRAYHKKASNYDAEVQRFSVFRSFGFDIPAWRSEAIQTLNLKPGDAVVDIGCGTGLNFPILQGAIGPGGVIIGVDLSDAMLQQARQRVRDNHWQNVELVCADAAQYTYPADVDGIISTFALILVPEPGQAVANGCKALRPGGRFCVLDMAWPTGWSLRWRYVLFFLRSYGLTRETLERQPWVTIWKTIDENLVDVTRKRFWYGFMYLAAGVRRKQ